MYTMPGSAPRFSEASTSRDSQIPPSLNQNHSLTGGSANVNTSSSIAALQGLRDDLAVLLEMKRRASNGMKPRDHSGHVHQAAPLPPDLLAGATLEEQLSPIQDQRNPSRYGYEDMVDSDSQNAPSRSAQGTCLFRKASGNERATAPEAGEPRSNRDKYMKDLGMRCSAPSGSGSDIKKGSWEAAVSAAVAEVDIERTAQRNNLSSHQIGGQSGIINGSELPEELALQVKVEQKNAQRSGPAGRTISASGFGPGVSIEELRRANMRRSTSHRTPHSGSVSADAYPPPMSRALSPSASFQGHGGQTRPVSTSAIPESMWNALESGGVEESVRSSAPATCGRRGELLRSTSRRGAYPGPLARHMASHGSPSPRQSGSGEHWHGLPDHAPHSHSAATHPSYANNLQAFDRMLAELEKNNITVKGPPSVAGRKLDRSQTCSSRAPRATDHELQGIGSETSAAGEAAGVRGVAAAAAAHVPTQRLLRTCASHGGDRRDILEIMPARGARGRSRLQAVTERAEGEGEAEEEEEEGPGSSRCSSLSLPLVPLNEDDAANDV